MLAHITGLEVLFVVTVYLVGIGSGLLVAHRGRVAERNRSDRNG